MDMSTGAGPLKRLLTAEEVEAEYGFTVNTLRQWRHSNKGPNYVKTGSATAAAVRYRRSDVETWLDECTIRTADPVAQAA